MFNKGKVKLVIKLIKEIAISKRACIIRVNNKIKGSMKIITILMCSLEILGGLRIISNHKTLLPQ